MDYEKSLELRKHVFANVLGWSPEQALGLEKESMAHQMGATKISTRDLRWIRFSIGSPLPVPDVMKESLARLTVEFRSSFSPYTQSLSVKKLHANFKDMVFSWYAADASVSPDEMKHLSKDASIPQEAKAQLNWAANFVQSSGLMLLQPGTSDDPASSAYGNLNDKHLSHYGYAFSNFVNVQEGKPSVPLQTEPYPINNPANPWAGAFQEQMARPDTLMGKIFTIEVGKTQSGAFGLFATFKTPDKSADRSIPITALVDSSKFDIDNDATYRGLSKFFINEILPGQSFVYAPQGPNGPVKLVAGTQPVIKNNWKKNMHHYLQQYEDHGADMYQHEQKKYRLLAQMNKQMQHRPHLYKIVFDTEEGGLIAFNPYTGGSFPLTQGQVKSLIHPGATANKYHTGGNSPFYRMHPAKQPADADGQPKPPGFGKWDIAEADKQKLRSQFKPILDMLSGTLSKYRQEKNVNNAEYRPHTPTQNYKWIVVIPRFENPSMYAGKAKAMIFNREWTPDGAGAVAQPQQQTGMSVANTNSEKMTKEAIVYNPSEGIRNWVIITHDVNPSKQQQVGGKRFPYEAMRGSHLVAYPTAEAAITALSSEYNIKTPDLAAIKSADAVLQQALAEASTMKYDANTPEFQADNQEIEQQNQLSGQQRKAVVPQQPAPAQPVSVATPQPQQQEPVIPVENPVTEPVSSDLLVQDEKLSTQALKKLLLKKVGKNSF